MMFFHIANTYFEEELSLKKFSSPSIALGNHNIYRKLQWLPFLYADSADEVLVTEPPPESFFAHLPSFSRPRYRLLSSCHHFQNAELLSWGASPSLTAFAKKHHLLYNIPSWEIVRKVNGKDFSYLHSPHLPGSALLHSKEQAIDWCSKQSGPAVLKTCFGLSGRGHLFLPQDYPRLSSFLQKALQKGDPVIGEPWVQRSFDFSTQWEILQPGEIHYLGQTICVNDAKGCYRETRIGAFPFPHWLQEHKETALSLLEKIKALGYFGHIGIDAMVYKDEQGKKILHPIVEVNARKTMGWVTLMLQKRLFPNLSISASFYLTRNDLDVIVKPWSC